MVSAGAGGGSAAVPEVRAPQGDWATGEWVMPCPKLSPGGVIRILRAFCATYMGGVEVVETAPWTFRLRKRAFWTAIWSPPTHGTARVARDPAQGLYLHLAWRQAPLWLYGTNGRKRTQDFWRDFQYELTDALSGGADLAASRDRRAPGHPAAGAVDEAYLQKVQEIGRAYRPLWRAMPIYAWGILALGVGIALTGLGGVVPGLLVIGLGLVILGFGVIRYRRREAPAGTSFFAYAIAGVAVVLAAILSFFGGVEAGLLSLAVAVVAYVIARRIDRKPILPRRPAGGRQGS